MGGGCKDEFLQGSFNKYVRNCPGHNRLDINLNILLNLGGGGISPYIQYVLTKVPYINIIIRYGGKKWLGKDGQLGWELGTIKGTFQ